MTDPLHVKAEVPATPDNIAECADLATWHQRQNSSTWRAVQHNAGMDGDRTRAKYTALVEQLPETATEVEIEAAVREFLVENATAATRKVTVMRVLYARYRLTRAFEALYADDPAGAALVEARRIASTDNEHTVEQYASRAYEAGVRWWSDDDEILTAVGRAREKLGISWWSSESETLTRARFTRARDDARRIRWEEAARTASYDAPRALPLLRKEAEKLGLHADSTPEEIDETVAAHLLNTYPQWSAAERRESTPLSTVRLTRAVAEMQAIRAAHASSAEWLPLTPSNVESVVAEHMTGVVGGTIVGPDDIGTRVDIAPPITGPDGNPDHIPAILSPGTVQAIPLDDEGKPRPGAAVVMGAFHSIGLAADEERRERARLELPKYLAAKLAEDGVTLDDAVDETREHLTTGPGELTDAQRAYLDEVFLPVADKIAGGDEVAVNVPRQYGTKHESLTVTMHSADPEVAEALLGTGYRWDSPDGRGDTGGFVGRVAEAALADEERRARGEAIHTDPINRDPWLVQALDALTTRVDTSYWWTRAAVRDLRSWLKFL